VDAIALYIKSDDDTLSYENISLTGQNDDTAVNVMYAPDSEGQPGTYVESLVLPNGYFLPAVKVWRRVFCTNVTSAFDRTDIKHGLAWDEYKL
jgi:hypothetical protein